MAVLQSLTLLNTPNQRQTTTLGGVNYEVEFRWRERTRGWYISIFTLDGEALVEGRRLRLGANAIDAVEGIDGLLWGEGDDYPHYTDDFSVIYAYGE